MIYDKKRGAYRDAAGMQHRLFEGAQKVPREGNRSRTEWPSCTRQDWDDIDKKMDKKVYNKCTSQLQNNTQSTGDLNQADPSKTYNDVG